MDIMEVLEHLPQRYPFLLVDRVVAIEPGKWIHAYKNVSINEPHFVGHFPGYPVMPGVLIMEALAQAAGILAFRTAGIDEARFKKPVMPGDQLHLHVEIERHMRGVWKFKAEARVDDQLVAEARLMSAKRDI